MSFCFDRTGFPLFFIPDLAIEVHLLPVTWAQLKSYTAQAGVSQADQWWQDAPTTIQGIAAGELEKLFVTGILPEESLAFARWMGEGFDLPTLDEWRAIYRALDCEPISVCQSMLQSVDNPARAVLEALLAQTQAQSLLDLSLMRGGLLEWVSQDTEWLGRGQPRQAFFPNLFDPLSDKDDQIRPIQIKRSRYFGFRLVRRNVRPVTEAAVNVPAGQHVFTSVEKEQSPQGKEGFQTLFYTRSVLSKSEAEDIETRLVYSLSEIEPTDRIFFTLSSGKAVTTQIVPLAEPDRFGRRGRYLAHSLIFAPGAFAQSGADPFYIFRHFPFIADVGEALKSGNYKTGDMGIVVREACAEPAHTVQAATGWPTADLKQLALLALQAEHLARERSAVAFVGEPASVETALEAAFLAVPTPLRPHCTFDTYFYHCNLANTYFWGVGLLEPPNDPRFIAVDTRSRQVLNVALNPQTAYEQWVVDQLEPGNLNLIAHWKDYAFALCEWLDGRSACDTSLVEESPQDIIESTFQANARQVQELLHNKLLKDEQLPPRLVNRISEQVYRQMRAIEHYRRLRQGFELPQLLKILYEVYKAREFRPPQREEIQDLGVLAGKIEHRPLRALHACWSDLRQKLRRELEHLSQDDYREFVRTALRAGLLDDPLAFLAPVRGAVFLDLYLEVCQEHEWSALVKALLASRETDSLARLAPRVSGWPARELRSLHKMIEKRPDVPELFRQAVSEAVASLPPDQ